MLLLHPIFKDLLLLCVGDDLLPNNCLVYRIYLTIVVWVWGHWYGECDISHPLYQLTNMVFRIIFRSDEGVDLFGGLGELIGSIPWMRQVIDVDEAVMLL